MVPLTPEGINSFVTFEVHLVTKCYINTLGNYVPLPIRYDRVNIIQLKASLTVKFNLIF